MRVQSRSMLHGPLFSHIVVYTIPIILTSLLQLLFNAADLVVVGRFCGSISVAAVGATGALTNLKSQISSLLGALQPDREPVHRTFSGYRCSSCPRVRCPCR